MITKLTHATIYVGDYDDALTFYTETVGFGKRSDDAWGDGNRWVTVAVAGQDVELVLRTPSSAEERALVGKTPPFVVATDDCRAAYETLTERGVTFSIAPEEQMWGIQAMFEDPYGNPFVLVEPPPMQEAAS